MERGLVLAYKIPYKHLIDLYDQALKELEQSRDYIEELEQKLASYEQEEK
jgi:hypothetical protein